MWESLDGHARILIALVKLPMWNSPAFDPSHPLRCGGDDRTGTPGVESQRHLLSQVGHQVGDGNAGFAEVGPEANALQGGIEDGTVGARVIEAEADRETAAQSGVDVRQRGSVQLQGKDLAGILVGARAGEVARHRCAASAGIAVPAP